MAVEVHQSPRQRLETALGCIKNARVRMQIRRIFENEIREASVFWDENERQVELIADDWEIIFRERDGQRTVPRVSDLIERWRNEALTLDKKRDADAEDLQRRDTLYFCAAELERLIE